MAGVLIWSLGTLIAPPCAKLSEQPPHAFANLPRANLYKVLKQAARITACSARGTSWRLLQTERQLVFVTLCASTMLRS
jgi:hypothetical protein